MVSMPHSRNPSTAFGPKVMSGFLNKDILYGVHVTLTAGAVAFKWDKTTGNYETVDLSSVAGNHLELPLHNPDDGHWDLAVGVDDQDNMFITGNHRPSSFQVVATTHLLRCANPDDFTNPSSWVAEPTTHWDDLGDPAAGTRSVNCYHLFDRMTDGTLLHFPSIAVSLDLLHHRAWGGFKRKNGVWSDIIDGGFFAIPNNTVEAARVYITAVLIEPRAEGDRVHINGIWRVYPGIDANTAEQPFYIYTDDPGLTTWRYLKVGAPGYGVQPMPLEWDTRTTATVTSFDTWSEGSVPSIYINPATSAPSFYWRVRDTSTRRRCFWTPGVGWGYEDTTEPLHIMEIQWKGERWRRSNGPGRCGFRNNSNQLVMYGPQIANVYTYTFDPVWLRERNVIAACIGEGDTPKVWTIGDGARVRVA